MAKKLKFLSKGKKLMFNRYLKKINTSEAINAPQKSLFAIQII